MLLSVLGGEDKQMRDDFPELTVGLLGFGLEFLFGEFGFAT
jgi:hypothetical protein